MQARKSKLLVTLAIVFAAALTIYLSCAAPSVMYGDSAELQAVALEGGVAHPTGYPTFILLGRLFGRVLGGDEAHRITNLYAAAFFNRNLVGDRRYQRYLTPGRVRKEGLPVEFFVVNGGGKASRR